MKKKVVKDYINEELRKRDAYLLPLRLFMGIGWLRAGLEKFMDSSWFQGKGVEDFLTEQLANGHIVFPFYRFLVENVFLEHTVILAWLIIIGQLLAGVFISLGLFCNLGLLIGMFMNFNFVLAGAVNPSAFYLVIQTILFCANAGTVLGFDTRLSKTIPIALFVSQPDFFRSALRIEKYSFLLLPLISLAIAIYASLNVRDYSPHGVHDPALILLVLAIFGGLATGITYLRIVRAQDEDE